MKKLLLACIMFFAFSLNFAQARSGCCSWHGGVCGCGCCDGTSLSATCAPYYPSCSSSKTYSTISTVEIIPTRHYAPVASAKRVYKTYDSNTVWELSTWSIYGWGTRKPFGSAQAFLNRGYKWSDIKIISDSELNKYKYDASFGTY